MCSIQQGKEKRWMFQIFVDRKYDRARMWSNDVLRQIAPVFSGEIANVSGWDDRDKEGKTYRDYFSGHAGYSLTNYPGHCGYAGRLGEIELDLTDDLPDSLSQRFDVVFNHTTFEHIFEIRKAFANFCEMTRDAAIVVVPFSQVQHESDSWGDYWRFTPTCLRKLFAENGLEIVYESESRDRSGAVYLLFVGSRKPEYYDGRLPSFRKIEIAGAWIGASILVSGFQYLKNKARESLLMTAKK
jgi:hypothetical protein